MDFGFFLFCLPLLAVGFWFLVFGIFFLFLVLLSQKKNFKKKFFFSFSKIIFFSFTFPFFLFFCFHFLKNSRKKQ